MSSRRLDRFRRPPIAVRWLRLAILFGSVLGLPACHADSAPPSPAQTAPMILGLSTHFDQGTPTELLQRVSDLGFTSIRDDMPWGKGERQKGVYSFGINESGFIATACRAGLNVTLMVDPRNQAYDGGNIAYSADGQRAFARFLLALLDHYGDKCIAAVEIGNEINAQGSHFPEGVDGVIAWNSLLALVYEAVHVRHPHIAILGGSTNGIGTGFLADLFRYGALAHMDGVSVHPYRAYPENVDVEIAHLQDVIRKSGPLKPIWATEFGNDFLSAEEVPSFMVRSVALMSAAGVTRAYWYDLLDEAAFRNQGLLTTDLRAKPASEGARTVHLMLEGDRAVRLALDDPTIFAFRFGTTTVLWGAPRSISFTGDPRFYDSSGHPVSPPDMVGPDPVIITGVYSLALGKRQVMADSLYEFGKAPFTYLARRTNGTLIRLREIDWTWSSYYGDPELAPLALSADGGVAAGDHDNPTALIWRLQSPVSGHLTLTACITRKREGDGLNVSIRKGRQIIYSGVARDRLSISRPIDVDQGDIIDLGLAPHGSALSNSAAVRWRLASGSGSTAVPCF